MRCLIVAEGSHVIGAGHQIRSAALYRSFKARDIPVHLCARDLKGSSHVWAWHGLDYTVADADCLEDFIVACVESFRADLIIVDHYAVDMARLQQRCPELCLVLRDDQPQMRLGLSDVMIFNSGLGASPQQYYQHAGLFGPAWHVLAPPIFEARWQPQHYVLLSLGLSDTYDMIDAAIEYVLDNYQVELRVICSEEQVIQLQERGPRVVYHCNEDARGMAALLSGAKSALLSASSIALEALHIGVPFVAIEFADNQADLAQHLRQRGIAVHAAHEITQALDACMLELQSKAVSPFTANADLRIIQRLQLCQALRNSSLRLLRWSDACRIWEWANDPVTRQQSFSEQVFIPWLDHLQWFETLLMDPLRCAFMYCEDGQCLAFLRVDVIGEDGVVGINVSPHARGRGVGARALRALTAVCKTQGQLRCLIAEIQASNTASQKVFEKAMYYRHEPCIIYNQDAYRYRLDLQEDAACV